MSDENEKKCKHGYNLVHKRHCRDCELQELEQENERLKVEIERVKDTANEFHKNNSILRNDNFKLKKLLKDIYDNTLIYEYPELEERIENVLREV